MYCKWEHNAEYKMALLKIQAIKKTLLKIECRYSYFIISSDIFSVILKINNNNTIA